MSQTTARTGGLEHRIEEPKNNRPKLQDCSSSSTPVTQLAILDVVVNISCSFSNQMSYVI